MSAATVPKLSETLGWDTRCMRALLQHQLILLKVTCESLAVAIVVSNSFHAGLGTGPRTMWGWKVRWKQTLKTPTAGVEDGQGAG